MSFEIHILTGILDMFYSKDSAWLVLYSLLV